jgi:DNA-binding response OmpR family regulator
LKIACREFNTGIVPWFLLQIMTNSFQAGETLKQAGFAAEELENASLVISASQRLRPDIVMLEVMMPGMDGFSICEGIRNLSEGYTTPMIMMTGVDDIKSVKNAYNAGTTDITASQIHTSGRRNRLDYGN